MMENLKIVYLSPNDLTPYEGNTRRHGDEDIEGIKESIRRVGFRDPIGIWGGDNIIVEGHGRQRAAIELGIEKVPCIRLDDMTDEQRREYSIRHNRSAELSGWDFGKLEEELGRLEEEGIDLKDLKFDFDVDMPKDLDADSNDEAKTGVQVQITFEDVMTWHNNEKAIKEIAENCNAILTVRMA